MVKTSHPANLTWCLRGLAGTLAALAAGVVLADAAPSTATTSPGAGAAPTAIATAVAKPVPLPAGQVWECMVNGRRTFSDVRCGAQSSIRQLGPINLMDASSAAPSARYAVYPTAYASRPSPPPQMDADDNAPDVGNDTYWGPGVIVVNQRPLRGHHPPHSNHGHGRAAKN